jgi:hypothetical protein
MYPPGDAIVHYDLGFIETVLVALPYTKAFAGL